MQPKCLSVLGIGLLGGSIGLAAKERITDCRIMGYAHRPETLQAALGRGAIQAGYEDPRRAVEGADLVVLCTPVGILGELLDRIAGDLMPRAIVTDVGSTKRSVVAHATRALAGSTARFVGSHPMAGSEKRGVEHAAADLFVGATCVTTPDGSTDPGALSAVESFWARLGMHIVRMSPEDHDRRVAEISHLPHALAAALVAMQDDSSLAVAGNGFADATRIAAGDGGLWRDIFLDNRDNLRASLVRLRGSLDEMLACLGPEQGESLKAWLDAAAARRQAWGESRDWGVKRRE